MSMEVAISIHAPAKGATRTSEPEPENQIISIHAPAKGATRPAARQTPSAPISIHAPAKGATCASTSMRAALAFQSTLPRRERHVDLIQRVCDA